MDLLIVFGLSGIVFGGACAILATNKKRDALGWFALGVVFNLIALIVIAALSPLDTATLAEAETRSKRGDEGEAAERDELRHRAADLAVSLAQSKAKLNG